MQKVKFRNLPSIVSLLLLAVLLTFSNNISAQEGEANDATVTAEADAETPAAEGVGDAEVGKTLFNANCAACHKLYKKATGPALFEVSKKYDREWLYSWIKNSQALIAAGDQQAIAIFEEYNKSVMTPFPGLSNTDIDNILAYTDTPKPEPIIAEGGPVQEGGGSGVSNNIILGALALVFLLLVVMLILVNKTLKKIAEANGVVYEEKEKRAPLWRVFVENQFLVLVTAIFLLLSAGYFMYGYFMQVGVDQGYAPVQPIHYSHRIHAGDNEIDCKYCHSSARKSKTSGIPSLNVCMNCHKNISEVSDDTYAMGMDEYGVDYNAEIQKLYKAVGWDQSTQQYTGKTEPVKWVRIHNLPDFAYFNHSQHVTVAGIDCQKCHGPVEEMEIMEQFSPLTMGWCINCHRETNVNVAGNEYYKEIHEQLSKKYGVDQLTAAQMGGLECGKCHY
ncbi:c-type cytochrome [Marinirhabdus gelatinilytica]|uniref:Quinol:cytochrome c oxidoreductase pentaheme cytochrome subunit n=1 Tax=Marinirhabdus gelatinilytica TaxID=1703343 RepID=A0A370QIJ7_9FLAO|nr:c-type cytochrome [Marinirhabdus gelatinilytica]RDK88176.1 quinol:cytochrome c oxidoreductase pentaheme cytochrome subunit [Marinirhabdus gelatinilytica]